MPLQESERKTLKIILIIYYISHPVLERNKYPILCSISTIEITITSRTSHNQMLQKPKQSYIVNKRTGKGPCPSFRTKEWERECYGHGTRIPLSPRMGGVSETAYWRGLCKICTIKILVTKYSIEILELYKRRVNEII